MADNTNGNLLLKENTAKKPAESIKLLGNKIISLAFYSRKMEKEWPLVHGLTSGELARKLEDPVLEQKRIEFKNLIDNIESELKTIINSALAQNQETSRLSYSVGVTRHFGDAISKAPYSDDIGVMVNMTEDIASAVLFPNGTKRDYRIEHIHYAIGELLEDIAAYPKSVITDANSKMLPRDRGADSEPEFFEEPLRSMNSN